LSSRTYFGISLFGLMNLGLKAPPVGGVLYPGHIAYPKNTPSTHPSLRLRVPQVFPLSPDDPTGWQDYFFPIASRKICDNLIRGG
jgi:hypothetical protein